MALGSPTDSGRAEAAWFLRNRRASLTPEFVGIDPGTRRRTPGLRREEVASLASVSLTWYTWLEQGRKINVSSDVLNALCRAHLAGRYTIEVVDVLAAQQRALADHIRMTPTLLKLSPGPVQRMVGTLGQTQRVLQTLGLEPVAQ